VILGLSLILAAGLVALPLFRLCFVGVLIVASIEDLNAAVASLDASVQALAATPIPGQVDLQPAIDRINADRTQIDQVTLALGGTLPPTP
jgi:hypothetical protein